MHLQKVPFGSFMVSGKAASLRVSDHCARLRFYCCPPVPLNNNGEGFALCESMESPIGPLYCCGDAHITRFDIGFGGTSDVHEICHYARVDEPSICAIKTPRNRKLNSLSKDHQSQYVKRQWENARIWLSFHHSHIVPLLGLAFDEDEPNAPLFVMPLYENGTILQYLRTCKMTSPNILRLVVQLAGALCYLHDSCILHGDVKSSNVLINDYGEAVLADFNMSNQLRANKIEADSGCGSVRWMSEEQLRNYFYSEDHSEYNAISIQSTATDVWAFGMTVVEIFTLKKPFHRIKLEHLIPLAVIKYGQLPSSEDSSEVPTYLWNLLHQCWAIPATSRIPMSDVYEYLKTDILGELA